MKKAGRHLLAATGLAGQQHRRVDAGQFSEQPLDAPRCCRAPEDFVSGAFIRSDGFQPGEQRLDVEGFRHVVGRAGAHQSDGLVDVGVTGDEKEGRSHGSGRLGEELLSAHVGKLDVADDRSETAGLHRGQRVPAVSPPLDGDAVQCEPLHKALTHDRVILDEGDASLITQHRPTPFRGG